MGRAKGTYTSTAGELSEDSFGSVLGARRGAGANNALTGARRARLLALIDSDRAQAWRELSRFAGEFTGPDATRSLTALLCELASKAADERALVERERLEERLDELGIRPRHAQRIWRHPRTGTLHLTLAGGAREHRTACDRLIDTDDGWAPAATGGWRLAESGDRKAGRICRQCEPVAFMLAETRSAVPAPLASAQQDRHLRDTFAQQLAGTFAQALDAGNGPEACESLADASARLYRHALVSFVACALADEGEIAIARIAGHARALARQGRGARPRDSASRRTERWWALVNDALDQDQDQWRFAAAVEIAARGLV